MMLIRCLMSFEGPSSVQKAVVVADVVMPALLLLLHPVHRWRPRGPRVDPVDLAGVEHALVQVVLPASMCAMMPMFR